MNSFCRCIINLSSISSCKNDIWSQGGATKYESISLRYLKKVLNMFEISPKYIIHMSVFLLILGTHFIMALGFFNRKLWKNKWLMMYSVYSVTSYLVFAFYHVLQSLCFITCLKMYWYFLIYSVDKNSNLRMSSFIYQISNTDNYIHRVR